jgi:hypothetical protein
MAERDVFDFVAIQIFFEFGGRHDVTPFYVVVYY